MDSGGAYGVTGLPIQATLPGRRIAEGTMNRAVAIVSAALLLAAFAPRPAHAAWTCFAESNSGSASASEASRKEAEDRALANCATASARFAICKIVKCQRAHGHW